MACFQSAHRFFIHLHGGELQTDPELACSSGRLGEPAGQYRPHAHEAMLINQWMENIANEVLRSLHADTNPYPRVDDADKDLTIIQVSQI